MKIPTFLAYACSEILYLCDGKQNKVVEEHQLGTFVDRLIELIDSESHVIIEKDTLLSLECLLGEDDKYYVKNACWIISNITARKENHIKAVIDSGLMNLLSMLLKVMTWLM
ncbi:hypothetical protein OROHE_013555 [Orobanche hederae]